MAESAGTAEEESGPVFSPPPSPPSKNKNKKKKQQEGIFSRFWSGLFGRNGGEDYEKSLRSLSKEEAAVHARTKRRAQGWRNTASNIVVFSFVVEAMAVIFAITTVRSADLNLQMRTFRLLPMFVIPALSYVIYSGLASVTGFLNQKDQKTLERLREERQAKIDELKEITNYYTTQQLIQRYGVDLVANSDAASVLASKWESDSDINLLLEDELKSNDSPWEMNDYDLNQTHGLHQRKHANIISQNVDEPSQETHPHLIQNDFVEEHYKSSSSIDRGWLPRLAAMLVGEDPTQCYALICQNCHMHNGLSRKEDFEYVTYYCPHCHVLNGRQQSIEQDHVPRSVSSAVTSPTPNNANDIHENVCISGQPTTETDISSNLAKVEEQTTSPVPVETQHLD